MSQKAAHGTDPRTRPVPPELVAFCRRLIDRWGKYEAARLLGISWSVLVKIDGRNPRIMPGSLALVREAHARLEGTRCLGAQGDEDLGPDVPPPDGEAA